MRETVGQAHSSAFDGYGHAANARVRTGTKAHTPLSRYQDRLHVRLSRPRRRRRAAGGGAFAAAEAILARQSAQRCRSGPGRGDRRGTGGASDTSYGHSESEQPAKVRTPKRKKNGGVRNVR